MRRASLPGHLYLVYCNDSIWRTKPCFSMEENGTNISWATGSTFAIHSLNNNDTISCVLSSNADCITANTANSNKIIVPVLTAPVPVISTSGPTTFCQGGSVTLTSSAANSYLWSKWRNKTRSITVNTAGSYWLLLSMQVVARETSSSKVIAINPLPVPTITADGLTTFCQGGRLRSLHLQQAVIYGATALLHNRLLLAVPGIIMLRLPTHRVAAHRQPGGYNCKSTSIAYSYRKRPDDLL